MMVEKVEGLLERHRELEAAMAQPETASDPSKMVKLGREYNNISKNMPVFRKYLDTVKAITDTHVKFLTMNLIKTLSLWLRMKYERMRQSCRILNSK